MRLWSDSIPLGRNIPERYAMGISSAAEIVEFGDNISPHISWDDIPAGASSLVLLCRDVDVPVTKQFVNARGHVIPATAPREEFFHWVLVDLGVNEAPLQEGEFSFGITKRGKRNESGPRNTRQGMNDYTKWFEGDSAMAGEYYGYDGPFPPWNDRKVHRYCFTLYALDIDRCDLPQKFTGPDVERAIKDHVIEFAEFHAYYSLNTP